MTHWLKKTANAIGGGLFVTLFIVFLVQIAARFGFGKPLAWTDEAAVILYIWVILWSAAVVVPEREHVVFDLIWNSVGHRTRQAMQIMGNLLLDLWHADKKAVLFVTHDLEEAIALSDRVVIMSAGPASRIIGDWKVNIARPRDISEVKVDKAFHELHREIWTVLKSEVMKGYAQAG